MMLGGGTEAGGGNGEPGGTELGDARVETEAGGGNGEPRGGSRPAEYQHGKVLPKHLVAV